MFRVSIHGLASELLVPNALDMTLLSDWLVEFYRDYLAVTKGRMPLDKTRFAVSRHAAPGLYLLVEALQGWDPWLVTGQITRPITILSEIQCEGRYCRYYIS